MSELKAWEPTWRESAASGLQSLLEKAGIDRYQARKLAQTVTGGESSNLAGIGLLDATPAGWGMGVQEGGLMTGRGVGKVSRGDYGGGAMDIGMGLMTGVGNAAPLVAAGVKAAPTVARAAIKGGENLAAPRALNPQTGAIVWHGSPHKFDKFDSSKIGTGEGAQAYGHGLYLADNPDVAKSYMRPAGRTPSEIDGKNVIDAAYADRSLERAARYLQDYGTPDEAIKWSGLNGDEKTSELLRNLVAAGRLKKAPDGEFYKVDLPDEAIAKMLDWDKPLSEQPDALAGVRAFAARPDMPAGFAKAVESALTRKFDGQDLYMEAFKVYKDAPSVAKAMREAGIPGIRYLDQGSRGAGSGTRNYVTFPGEEGLLKILERNGQGLLGQ